MDDVFEKILFKIVMKNFANATCVTMLSQFDLIHHFDKIIIMKDGAVFFVFFVIKIGC